MQLFSRFSRYLLFLMVVGSLGVVPAGCQSSQTVDEWMKNKPNSGIDNGPIAGMAFDDATGGRLDAEYVPICEKDANGNPTGKVEKYLLTPKSLTLVRRDNASVDRDKIEPVTNMFNFGLGAYWRLGRSDNVTVTQSQSQSSVGASSGDPRGSGPQ